MRISLAGSCANDFNKWCEVHDAGRKGDSRTGGDDAVIIANQDHDQAVMTPPERPHRPWLVPGVGTL